MTTNRPHCGPLVSMSHTHWPGELVPLYHDAMEQNLGAFESNPQLHFNGPGDKSKTYP